MGILDYLSDIASDITSTISDVVDKLDEISIEIPDDSPLASLSNSSDNSYSNQNNFKTDYIPEAVSIPVIIHFPKIELTARKSNNNTEKPLTIKDYEDKYVTKSLNSKINLMSDQEKAYTFYYIAFRHRELLRRLGVKSDVIDWVINYLDKALELCPNNIDFAYERYHIISSGFFSSTNKRTIEICEACIKISNNKDIKNEFSNIYYTMGDYYFLELKEYDKALECFNKSLEYDNSPLNDKLYTYKKISYVYKSIGDYKKSLEICEFIYNNDTDNKVNIIEFLEKMRKLVASGTTKEQEDYKNLLSDSKYTFSNSVGVYPDELIFKAYKIYLNARDLVSKGHRREAIEEYKRVKQMLPSEEPKIDGIISMHMVIGNSENENGFDNDELISTLNRRLRNALDFGNYKDVANIYNELGIAYSNIKQYEEAAEQYKNAIKSSSNPYLYIENLASAYENMRKYDEAISTYEKIKKEAPELAKQINIEHKISRLKDKKAGKNEKSHNLAEEHSQKGEQAFNKGNYVNAISEFNAALAIDKESIDNIFRQLICKEIYDDFYSDEEELLYSALSICEKSNEFNYLPFFYTCFGDAIYTSCDGDQNAAIYYELAVFFLNMIPINERFAAPYYKLGRLKEEFGKPQEALDLFEKAKAIDSSYDIDDDINRIKSRMSDDGFYNKTQYLKHMTQVEKYKKQNLYKMVYNEAKEALKYAPNSGNIYFALCRAAERLSLYYDMKWSATEGIRVLSNTNSSYSTEDYFYLYLVLGRLCKYEHKIDMAKRHFNFIMEADEYGNSKAKDCAMYEYPQPEDY